MHDHVSYYEMYRDHMRFPKFWETAANNCLLHFHSTIEMVYIIDGYLNATVGNENFVVNSGEFLVVPSYGVHKFETLESCNNIILQVPIDYISSFEKTIKNKRFSEIVIRKNKENEKFLDVIRHSMTELVKYPMTEETDSFVVRGNIYIILGKLLECVKTEEISKNSDSLLLKKVLIYLQDNFHTPITLETISKHFGYSKSRFSQIFNTNIGCKLTEYINVLRIKQAARMLTETDHSVTDIAMFSGFESMRTFYRVFNTLYAVTPSEYVEINHQANRLADQKSGSKSLHA